MEQTHAQPVCAVVTGASTGIGSELAKRFAADRRDVVLVARTESRLQALAEELQGRYSIKAHVLAMDLAEGGAARALYDRITELGLRVGWLVNNAGFGSSGRFLDTALGEYESMIGLNIASLSGLCRLFGEDMVARRGGRILNVASMAGFQPGPNMALYYATKAFVLSLSEALVEEFSGSGVTVSVLCPGPTVTEFQKRAQVEETRLFSGGWAMRAERVATIGYDGMMRGRAIIIPGVFNKLLVQGNRLMPRAIVRKVTGKLNS
jgi:hypothetical protein